jgi:P27 family predicted phage terminase small subunit
MPAGRPKKPTAQKKLEGTLRADRQIENEMMPSKIEFVPSAPRYLSAAAKKEWKLVCNELISLDMLTAVDLALLSAYCREMGEYIMACEKLDDPSIGYVMTINRSDGSVYSQVTPWVGIKNQALQKAQGLANQFGFTPAARARLEMPEKTDDPLAKALMRLKEANG